MTSPKPARVRKPVALPDLLLEADAPARVEASGPGERFALGPTRLREPSLATSLAPQELPESYGTERLFLTARDPHWLYAAWDLTPQQRQRYHSQARDGHLALRTYVEAVQGAPEVEIALHPDSRNWFIQVGRGATPYVAELGYYDKAGAWKTVATSPATLTPPESPSVDSTVEFATIPPDVSLATLLQAVQEAVNANPQLQESFQRLHAPPARDLPRVPVTDLGPAPKLEQPALIPLPRKASAPDAERAQPAAARTDGKREGPAPTAEKPPLIEAVRQLRAEGATSLPETRPATVPTWTPEQERTLKEVVRIDESRRVWMGSLEITELIRRHLAEGLFSMAPAAPEQRRGRAPEEVGVGVSSVLSQEKAPGPAGKGFWLKVNAELIIYGATEPKATVSIGGRPIRLRPDGTFGYRFALPDGHYPLRILALSPDRTDQRGTRLEFSRKTQHEGEVGVHPQEPHLTTPDKPHAA